MILPGGSTRNLLIFNSNGMDCALPLEAVLEIIPMATLSSPPGMPSAVTGFLDLRGVAVPILRLDSLFDLPEQRAGLYTPLIILGRPAPRFGLLVNSVQQIVPAIPDSFLSLPDNRVFGNCVTATIEVNGRILPLLSADRILLENEGRLLANFQMMAQQRLDRLEVTD
jgi:purine-binding chemotaxis protein CheW